jgi:ribosomal protein S18 acetylase RimI-like enzyme
LKLTHWLLTARPTEQKIKLITDRHHLSPEEVELVIDTDPTERDYVAWIAKSYANKEIRLPEDTDKIKKQLESFTKLKRSPKFKGEKDIQKYTPATLYEVISANTQQVSQKEKDRQLINEGREGAKLILNDGDYKAYEVSDADALCSLSSNTNWCTAQKTYAQEYTYGSPNYVFYYKGKPYAQLDPDSGQFMDVKDNTLIDGESSLNGQQTPIDFIIDPIAVDFLEKTQNIPAIVKFYEKFKITPDTLKAYIHDILNIRKDWQFTRRITMALNIAASNRMSLAGVQARTNHGRNEDSESYVLHFLEQTADEEEVPYTNQEEYSAYNNALTAMLRAAIRYWGAVHHGQRNDILEKIIMPQGNEINKRPPELLQAVDYAKSVIGGRWPEFERDFLFWYRKNHRLETLGLTYANEIIKGRWLEMEEAINKVRTSDRWFADPEFAPLKEYCQLYKGRWPELETAMLDSTRIPLRNIFSYATDVIKGRWLQLERRMMTDGDSLATKMSYVQEIGKRWPEFENEILAGCMHSENAMYVMRAYMEHILRARWPELEDLLLHPEEKWFGFRPTHHDNHERALARTHDSVFYQYLMNLDELNLKWPEGWALYDKMYLNPAAPKQKASSDESLPHINFKLFDENDIIKLRAETDDGNTMGFIYAATGRGAYSQNTQSDVTPLENGLARIINVTVWVPYQRKGLAKQLYAEMFKILKSRGFKKVESDWFTLQPGKRVWRSMMLEDPTIEQGWRKWRDDYGKPQRRRYWKKPLSKLLIARPTEQKMKLLADQYKLAPEAIEMVIAADPTEKDYVMWLAKALAASQIRLPEDTEKIKGQLTAFNKLKRSPTFDGDKDIQSYTPASLYQTLQDNMGEMSNKEKNRDLIRSGAEGARLILNDGDYKVFEVTDPNLLMTLSSNTNWCTAQERYAKQYTSSGADYVFYYKGKPYAQYDPNSKQFMDVHDESLTETTGIHTKKRQGDWNAEYIHYLTDPISLGFIQRIKDPAIKDAFREFTSQAYTNRNKVVDAMLDERVNIIDALKYIRSQGAPMFAEQEAIALNLVEKGSDITGRGAPVISNAYIAFCDYWASFHKHERNPKLEQGILLGNWPFWVAGRVYAAQVLESRWPELENKILEWSARKSSEAQSEGLMYAVQVMKAPWPELEKSVIDNLCNGRIGTEYISSYIQSVKGHWPEMEERMVYSPDQYQNKTLAHFWKSNFGANQRWPGLEARIMREGNAPRRRQDAVEYCKMLGVRWPEIEPQLIDMVGNPKAESGRHLSTWMYLEDIVRGRWPELEHKLMNPLPGYAVGTVGINRLKADFAAYFHIIQQNGDSWPEGKEYYVKEISPLGTF